MKEKIERFSKGNFEYESPSIYLSENDIDITAEAGNITEGSFTVSNSAYLQMKGSIYTTDCHMVLVNSVFNEAENVINYRFDASLLNPGESIEGHFHIISDCGERTLYYNANIEPCYIQSSVGKITDLIQFTNLARMDWAEAKKVFRSENFERIFLNREKGFIYRNLLKTVSTSQALEEFLVSTHKKDAILLEIDKIYLEYSAGKDSITDKLVLTKNNWGYAEIRVSCDAAFIQLDQKFLWADRFIGNMHQVLFSIDQKQLKRGNNYGHIYIKTPLQSLTVSILCTNKNSHKATQNKLLNKAQIGLVRNYLDFRLNRIELNEYLEKTQAVLKYLPGPETGHDRELVKLHMAIISGDLDMAQELLNIIAVEAPRVKQKSVLDYCAYLYLNALYSKDERIIIEAAETIRRYYIRGYNDWRMLWLLIFIDRRYENNKSVMLADIKAQYMEGCISPILYYEAICCYNEEPSILRELTSFEIQVINYGIKNEILTCEVVRQFTYLANKKKTFHPIIFRSLERLYQIYNSEDILTAICCMLIKGMKKSQKYFEWFSLGVQSQLKITELYEYYMYSISELYQDTIAQPVMLYFIYNSNINDRKKALLYANIVKNKHSNENIYRSYCRRMEVFTLKMLEGHYISDNLAVLYREYIDRNMPDTELSRHLSYIIFRNEITCGNPNMVSVTILHRELETEETAQLTEGKALIDIYTDNYDMFFTDNFGNRYIGSVDYVLKPFLNPEDYVKHCIDNSNHPMPLLYTYNQYRKEYEAAENVITLMKRVLELEGLTRSYQNECCRVLIEYYYESCNDEQLIIILEKLDMSLINHDDIIKITEIMVNRACYDKALKVVDEFGYAGLSLNTLIKLCSGWLNTYGTDEKQPTLITLCYYLFIQNKYDEAILKYLVGFYRGSTAAMLSLWQAAKGFEVDTHKLEERLLKQLLFCESHMEDGFRVFCEYYKSGSSRLLTRAYLSYNAYRYLVHDANITAELFPIMRRELFYEDNEICLLAWLKKSAKDNELSQNDLNFAGYSIERLVREGIILPFFLEYRDKLTLPDRLTSKYYITYKSKPGTQVYIHYRLHGVDTEYVTERMPDIFMGIHVKELVLFYHDEVIYYFTEETPEGVSTSDEYNFTYVCTVTEDDITKYNQINRMLVASEMKDANALLGMLEAYVKTEYIVDACFRQI